MAPDQYSSRMDKPSVWRAVVSTTDPRRARDPGCQPPRPSSAMAYRLYDIHHMARRVVAESSESIQDT
ncbi:unnamed protein product [Gadus morhua 'NCC']